jgi:hypothetical protein
VSLLDIDVSTSQRPPIPNKLLHRSAEHFVNTMGPAAHQGSTGLRSLRNHPAHVDMAPRWRLCLCRPFTLEYPIHFWPYPTLRGAALYRQPTPTFFIQQMSRCLIYACPPFRIIYCTYLSAALNSANPCSVTLLHPLQRTCACQEAQCSNFSCRATLRLVMHS